MRKILLSTITVALFVIFGCSEPNSESKSEAPVVEKTEIKKFDLKTFQEETMPYWTTADIEDNTLKILVAPVFDTSKTPSAPNIATAIYNVAKNLCPTDYPELGKVALTIGWKENKSSHPHLIVHLAFYPT